MAVTPEQVEAAFLASQAAGSIGEATEALRDHLTPLFNDDPGSGYVETDPTVPDHVKGISEDDIAAWDAPPWSSIADKPTEFPPEYHTHAQYLTEETDPTVPAHVKDISEADIARWDEAATPSLSMLDLTDRVTGYTDPNYDVGTAKHLRWSRYGANHEIIDASGSQAPDLTSINQVDAATAWLPDMPVLMGWNGISTYGVRVDRSRYADSVEYGGVVRVSTGGAATMASLHASNLSGPGTRPLVASPDGDIDDQDAATFRATIDAAASVHGHAVADVTGLQGALDSRLLRMPAVIIGQDANDYKLNGIFQGHSVAHAPNSAWGVLRVYRGFDDSGDIVWQTWHCAGYIDDGLVYSRYSYDFGATWTGWQSIVARSRTADSVQFGGTIRISTGGAATMASLQASNLSGSGVRPLVASPDGDIDDQDAATFRATIGIQSVGRRLWAEKDKAQTYANSERSILGATSAQRKLAANTISDGTVIRLVAVGSFQASSSGSNLVVKLTCGPDGNYYSPYYLSSHGIPCAALAAVVGYKVEALLYFVGSGASAGVYVELTIQFFGADGVVSTYRNASAPGSPLDIDGSIDRYLDVFFQVSSGASSYSTITPTHSLAEIINP